MKKHGFTLAEVLIVLVILGVIAALTVPNLMGTASEKQRITSLKKGYADLNNALQLASAENGETPGAYIAAKSETVANMINAIFVPTLKIANVYDNGFQTMDGISYYFIDAGAPDSCSSIPTDSSQIGNSDNTCFYVIIDTDGKKGVNSITKSPVKGEIQDRFVLAMYDNGATAGVSVAGQIISDSVWKTASEYSSANPSLGSFNSSMLTAADGANESMTSMLKGSASSLSSSNGD